MNTQQISVEIDNSFFHMKVKDATMRDETSMSHYLRKKTALLGGRNYGEAFGSALLARGLIKEGMQVVEVGGGLGDLAKNLIPVLNGKISYTMVELSPALYRWQKKKLKKQKGIIHILGDGQKLSKHVRCADLIIANEVVGDFNAEIKDGKIMPSGQISFVGEISKVLNLGGAAVLVEHSSNKPRIVRCKGHDEVTMSIPILRDTAKKHKLSFTSGRIIDFLGADSEANVVDENWVNYVANFGVDDIKHLNLIEKRYKRARENLKKGLHPKYPPYEDVDMTEILKLGAGTSLIPNLETPYLFRERMWREASRNIRNKVYDQYLTPDEFKSAYQEIKWWNREFRHVKTTKLGDELREFKYVVLKK